MLGSSQEESRLDAETVAAKANTGCFIMNIRGLLRGSAVKRDEA